VGSDSEKVAPRLQLWAVLAVVSAGLVVWVWITARGTVEEFPGVLLQAESAALTALVFVLALSQSSLRRTAEAVVAQSRKWEEVLGTAYRDKPDSISSAAVWTHAASDHWALFTLRTPSGREAQRRVLREAERTDALWERKLTRLVTRRQVENTLGALGD
jgi:hypothetical protein